MGFKSCICPGSCASLLSLPFRLRGDIPRQTAEQCVGEFGAQDLANTAWAFATAGQPDVQLFTAFRKALCAMKVHWVNSLKRRGGMSRLVDFSARILEALGALLGALGAHFASFFRFRC